MYPALGRRRGARAQGSPSRPDPLRRRRSAGSRRPPSRTPGSTSTCSPDGGCSAASVPLRCGRTCGPPWRRVRAVVRAWRIVARHRPRVVLGVGGYASLPCVVAARLRRIPAVVHEQNAAPGLVNRVAVRLGARAAVSLPGTPLRGAVAHGQPRARRRRRRATRARHRHRSSRSSAGASVPVGSTTRRSTSTTAGATRADVTIRHVTGRRNEEQCRRRLDALRRSARHAWRTTSSATRTTWSTLYDARRRRGLSGGRGHHRRAGGHRHSVGARAAAGRARATTRPGTREAWSTPAPPSCAPTPSSTEPASRASWTRCSVIPTACRRWEPRRVPSRRPDAAARVADLVEEAAGVAA